MRGVDVAETLLGLGPRITLADGSSKDVREPFERVVSDAAAAKKEKGSAT